MKFLDINRWVLDWTLVLTLFGYAGLIKGVFLLAFPDYARFFGFMLKEGDSIYRIAGAVYMLFGLFLCYQGFAVH